MVSKRTKRWAENPTNVIDINENKANDSRARQARAEKIYQDKLKKVRARKNNKIPAFFDRPEWKRLRYRVLKRDGAKCQCCGIGTKDGAVMNVDHIKPRLEYPDLAMNMKNLQTLCADCNWGKGWRDKTDWR